MKALKFLTYTLLVTCVFMAAQTDVSAQGQRRGVYGDWNISSQIGERTMTSILALSRSQDGQTTGSWISFFSSTELKDVSLEDNQLQFTQTRRGRDGEVTSKFKGTIEDGKLKGVLTSDRGDSELTGERAPRTARAAGSWEMTIKAGEREYTGLLTLKSSASGELGGEWSSQRGVSPLENVVSSRNELSFNRTIKTQDSEWETSFSGKIQGNSITGVFKSDRGEAEATAERLGGEAIGTWNLSLESDRGTRTQRLKINPDLSGLYGSMAIDKMSLEGDKISFKNTLTLGDREFTSEFEGQIDGDSISGEMATGQGSRKVTGKKVARRSRRGR